MDSDQEFPKYWTAISNSFPVWKTNFALTDGFKVSRKLLISDSRSSIGACVQCCSQAIAFPRYGSGRALMRLTSADPPYVSLIMTGIPPRYSLLVRYYSPISP